jgi:integrase/recombinase XerD
MERVMEGSELRAITLGDPLLDAYLEFVGARGARNTWLATAYDLKVFFEVVGKEPAEVGAADVFAFLAQQRAPRRGEMVVRMEDGEPGLAARTIARRLSSVSGLFEYLVVRGDAGVARNPVPRGLAGRRAGQRGRGGIRLVRRPRTLPRVLSPAEVDGLLGALRTHRDRALVLAMLLAGLRRCEVLGLRLSDVNPGERRLLVAFGKGGRERIVPVSARFFEALGAYFESERPPDSKAEACFVVLKGARRGMPLTAAGLDEVLDGARSRAGLARVTCHMLRHTCFTRLREQGMSLEALQAQAGHRSIDSTRIYLHLTSDWLRGEYVRAAEALEAQDDPTAGRGEGAGSCRVFCRATRRSRRWWPPTARTLWRLGVSPRAR